MSKTVKNSLIIISILIVLFGIIWIVYDMVKKEPKDTDVNANVLDGNTGLDNMINTLFDNTVENEQTENEISNTVTNRDEEDKDTEVDDHKKDENQDGKKENEEQESTTESATAREEKAIELVKKEWGTTDGVYFSNESIDAQGRYIVSVRDRNTTASIMFYLVDVDKKLVTEQ